MSYTTAAVPYQLGPGMNNDGTGMIFEDIQVTGSGDTSGTYVTKYVVQPLRVLGPFTYTISGRTVSLASASLTGVETARIIGFA